MAYGNFTDLQASTVAHYQALLPHLREIFPEDPSAQLQVLHSVIDRYCDWQAPILDFGCGDGAVSLPLAQRGLEVHFYDPVPDNAHAITARLDPNSKSKAFGQVEHLAAAYSLVLVKEVLYHILDPEQRLATLRQLWGKLTDSGVILVQQTFLREDRYANPPEYMFVMETLVSKLKVYLRRELLRDLGIGAVHLRLETPEGRQTDIPPAYFATYGHDVFLQMTRRAGLQEVEVVDAETGGILHQAPLDRMVIAVLRKAGL